MITLIINNKKVKMPNKLSEIKLSEGIQILEMISDKEPDLNIKKSIISLLSKLSIDVIKHIKEESIIEIYDKFEFSKEEELELTYYPIFKLNGVKFGMIDFDNINVKDYADIEFWLNEGEYPFSYMGKLMSYVFKPIHRENKSFKNILINIINRIRYKNMVPLSLTKYKLKESDEEYENLFLDNLDFNFGYAILSYIYTFKMNIKNEYKLLFKTDEEIDQELNDPLRATKHEKSFTDIWGMYSIINDISENLFERDAWFNKPLRELYKYLSYNKQKKLIENKNE